MHKNGRHIWVPLVFPMIRQVRVANKSGNTQVPVLGSRFLITRIKLDKQRPTDTLAKRLSHHWFKGDIAVQPARTV